MIWNPSLPGNSYTSLGGLEAVLRDLYLTISSLVLSSIGKIVSSCANGSSPAPMRALGLRTQYQGAFCEFTKILECFDAEYGYALPGNSKMVQNEPFWWFSARVGVCHGAMTMGYEYVLEITSC